MNGPAQLWLCTQPTDLRKSYDGLIALVRGQLDRDPLSGHGFVFINRRRTQLKCLYFEAGGYCLWCKRLERGQYGRRDAVGAGVVGLSPAAFQALVEGLEWVVKKRHKRWQKQPLLGTAMVQ